MRNQALIWGIIAILIVGGVIIWAANRTPDATVGENSTTPTNGTNNGDNGSGRNPGQANAATLSATFISRSTAVLNGEVNPNGVQTSYRYEYGSSNSLGTVSSTQLIGSGYGTHSAPLPISNLTPETTYYYRIVAENQYGRTNGTILSFTTNDTPAVAYTPPTVETRSATSVTRNSAILNGATHPRGAETSYWFEYGRSASLGNTTSVGNAGSGNANAVVSGQITGLEAGTIYYYRLNAQNPHGIVNGNIFSFTTTENNPASSSGDRPTISTESTTAVSRTSATLRGQVDPEGSGTTYYFEYGKASLFGLFTLMEKTEVKSAGSGTTSVAVSTPIASLDASSTYHYRLVAENEHGTTIGAIHSFTTKE